MTNVSNNSLPFRTLSRDVLLMEKYQQTTYTRDKEGHLVVHEPAVIFQKLHNAILSGYWRPLPGPAQTNEDQIPVKKVFEAFGQQPILGDMRSKTKWSAFIKNE